MPTTSYLFTKPFWRGVTEKAAFAGAWVFLSVLGVPQVAEGAGFDVLRAGWTDALSFAAGAVILSVIKSVIVGASGIGPTGSPSLVDDRPTNTDLADGKAIIAEGHRARHADDGIDVALDNTEEATR